MGYYLEVVGQLLQSNGLEISDVETGKASFGIIFSSVSVIINYSNGQPPTGPICVSVMATAQAIVNADNSLALRLLKAAINVQDNSILSQILTNALAPLFVDYLNTNMLAPIKLPALGLLGASFSVPMVLTHSDFLLVFTSLQPATVVPPEASSWPRGITFIAADAQAINAVVNGAIATINLNGDWFWSLDINPGIISAGLQLQTQYNLRFSGANFKLVPGSGKDVTASFNVSGNASFFAKGGPFQMSFWANILGEVTATATIDIASQQVTAVFKSLDAIKVNLDFFGVPSILSSILNVLADKFVPVLTDTIASSFSEKSFELITIPTIGFCIGGISFIVLPTNFSLQTIPGPENVSLLTVTGFPNVQMGSKKA